MKTEHKIIALSVTFASLAWAIDSASEYGFLAQERFVAYGIVDPTTIQLLVRSVIVMCFLIFGGVTARMMARQKQIEEDLRNSQDQLRGFAAHLQAEVEKERTRIAREVHDQIGQTLTALHLDLFWLEKRWFGHDNALLDRIRSMRRVVDSAVQTVRVISTGLRPAILDDFGLAAAIAWQTEEFRERTNIEAEIHVDQDLVIGKELSTALFRILQETLTNVIRHARATKITVRLEQRHHQVALEISDNGEGISGEAVSSPKSLGLVGMRERAYLFGGHVAIQGVPGQGTTVSVSMPLNEVHANS